MFLDDCTHDNKLTEPYFNLIANNFNTSQVSEKLKEIIAAMVGATDQRDTGSSEELSVESQVALEALRGLAALLPRLPQETVLQHTPTLLIRIRLFSEKVSGPTTVMCVFFFFFNRILVELLIAVT